MLLHISVNKYSFPNEYSSPNQQSFPNEYSFANERIFVQSFRTNIRIFDIFVSALNLLSRLFPPGALHTPGRNPDEDAYGARPNSYGEAIL